jgi:6-phosphogluconolactonase
MTITEHLFDDRAAMTEALYKVFITDITQAINLNQQATILLSGGSTPVPLYQKLSTANLDWQKINTALVDERWVKTSNVASNERLLAENLYCNTTSYICFTGMKNEKPSAFAAEAECNTRYAKLPSPFTLCLLGMGPDGHTASLFPGAKGLEQALNAEQHCAAIQAVSSETTGEFVERMTMTRWGILKSRKIILLITGDDKWEVYQQARNSPASVDLPVSFFLHQDAVPVDVYWTR